MKLVTEGVWNFERLFAGRVYMLEDADGLTLVDTGLLLAAPRIVQQIEAQGWDAQTEVKRILITHAHPDHVGGLADLKEFTGAEVIASAIEKPYVEGKQALERPPREGLSRKAKLMWRRPAPVKGGPVDRSVEDGDVLEEVWGGLQVIGTPGHSPGHISFWQAERRILFAGDVVTHFLGLGLPPAAFTPDMAENIRSLQRLAELEPEVVCFGHGSALTIDTTRRMQGFVARVQQKLADIEVSIE